MAASKIGYRYIKFIEFAYRSSPIGDTQLTPFEAARGRLPRLVSDNPLLDSELPADRSIDVHMVEMKQLMKLAAQELEAAKEVDEGQPRLAESEARRRVLCRRRGRDVL